MALEKDKIIQHESFGLISACRSNGSDGHFFYGSDMRPNNYITITLRKNCQIEYDPVLGKRYTEGKNDINDVVEIEMTATQFAEFITTLNVGQGVPCNVTRFGRPERLERYDERLDSKYEYEYQKAVNMLKEHRGSYRDAESKIMELCEKLPKVKKDEICRVLHKLEMQVCDNVPFHINNIKKASEDIVSKAKTEIANYVSVASNVVADKHIGLKERPLELDVNIKAEEIE